MVEGEAKDCHQWHAAGQFGGGAARRQKKYLVLMTPVVVEGFPNEGTPDQLGVAMLYLQAKGFR